MTNQQFDFVISLAREKNIDLSACPTCRQRRKEMAPGIWIWEPSTYKLDDKTYDCHCEWQDNLRRHYLLAGIPSEYWTLSEIDFFGDSQALEASLHYLENWVDWKWHGMGVEFYSPNLGTGKTMLATIIAKKLIVQGEKILFIPFRDTLRLWEKQAEEVRRLRHSPVLILDEITPAWSNAQRSFYAAELEDLIRFRTNGNSITITTTNMTPGELEEEYPRVFSLLSPKQTHISVGGGDVRKSGDLDLLRQEMILNNEARPIT